KLKNVRHKVLIEGIPVIKENTCCWFLCKVIKSMEVDKQWIFVAEVQAGSDVSVGVPMTYAYYTTVLKGTATLDSPAYFPPDMTFDKSSGESFTCSVCGYTYSDPNFSFEELEEDWKCPVCKMPKKAFIRR
ncbi:MAG: rubredoxin, partial [Oscillospiraceae bacterium]